MSNYMGTGSKVKALEVASIKVKAVSISPEQTASTISLSPYSPTPQTHHQAYIEGNWQPIPIYAWETLVAGATISGPALVLNKTSTLVVAPHWEFVLDMKLTAHLQFLKSDDGLIAAASDHTPIQLELFTNRFRSIVEEMGALLERTAFSVNVKERLDFLVPC